MASAVSPERKPTFHPHIISLDKVYSHRYAAANVFLVLLDPSSDQHHDASHLWVLIWTHADRDTLP